MSLEKSYHKTPEERVKSIEEHLKTLESAAGFLNNLTNHESDCGEKTVTLGIDTLGYFGSIMDMAVDTFSAELGLFRYEGRPDAFAFIRKPQAGKGETPFHEIPVVQALNALVELNNLAPEQLANVKDYVEGLKAEATAQGGAA
jgi:hypothetical protein